MVSGSTSEIGGSVAGKSPSAPLLTYSEKFHEVFPHYLAIGMTYEQFWDMDCTLVVAYRKAEEIRNMKRNQELWLQGMYFYEALCDVAPILRAFAKKGTKPLQYPSEPYSLTNKEQERREAKRERQVFNKGLEMMKAFMGAHNKKFEAGEKVKDDADDD